MINLIFYGAKEAGDNRWLNSSIFYNSTIRKKEGPLKDFSEMEMLNPNHILLKEDMNWKVEVKSLFNDKIFISIHDFNAKFGAKINTLSHRFLKNIVKSNLQTKERSRLDNNEQKVDSHWIFNLPSLFSKTKRAQKSLDMYSTMEHLSRLTTSLTGGKRR